MFNSTMGPITGGGGQAQNANPFAPPSFQSPSSLNTPVYHPLPMQTLPQMPALPGQGGAGGPAPFANNPMLAQFFANLQQHSPAQFANIMQPFQGAITPHGGMSSMIAQGMMGGQQQPTPQGAIVPHGGLSSLIAQAMMSGHPTAPVAPQAPQPMSIAAPKAPTSGSIVY